jgi:hypothetical protein
LRRLALHPGLEPSEVLADAPLEAVLPRLDDELVEIVLK